MSKNYIVIIAHARSGSTYLCRLMKNISELNVLLEIFHFKLDVIKSYLKDLYPILSDSLNFPNDEKLIRTHILKHCQKYLSILQEENRDPNKILTFKVFPGHLPYRQLSEVLGESRLILILHRNLLHSYISNTIAVKMQKWDNIDTSQEKVKFSDVNFINHVSQVTKFYDSVKDIVEKSNVKCIELDYETYSNSENPLPLLVTKLRGALDIYLQFTNDNINIVKQDKRRFASDKVLNLSEMLHYLNNYGLEQLNDGQSNISYDEYSNLK